MKPAFLGGVRAAIEIRAAMSASSPARAARVGAPIDGERRQRLYVRRAWHQTFDRRQFVDERARAGGGVAEAAAASAAGGGVQAAGLSALQPRDAALQRGQLDQAGRSPAGAAIAAGPEAAATTGRPGRRRRPGAGRERLAAPGERRTLRTRWLRQRPRSCRRPRTPSSPRSRMPKSLAATPRPVAVGGELGGIRQDWSSKPSVGQKI